MVNKTNLKSICIAALILLFPILWLYNQKINYRSFFQFDESMLLIGADERPHDLSSVVYVLDALRSSFDQVELLPKNIGASDFGVLGRIVTTPNGPLEIYEYGSAKQANKFLSKTDTAAIYRYKNLLIYNKSDNTELSKVIKSTFNEN